MQCDSFFQPIVDYVKSHPPAPPMLEPGPHRPTMTFHVAGHRAGANHFAYYMYGELTHLTTSVEIVPRNPTEPPKGPSTGPSTVGPIEAFEVIKLFGTSRAYYSNRLGPDQLQPFYEPQSELFDVTLTVPDGPLIFQGGGIEGGGNLVMSFSAFECKDNGLLVCTEDLGVSTVVLSFHGE